MTNTTLVAASAVLAVTFIGGCTTFKRFAYEGFGRERWQQPEKVIQTLGIQPGQRIADLGAGGGYFTFRLADATGQGGTVYAVDIDPDMIAYLKQHAADEGYRNVEVIEAAPDDPRLPDQGVDLIFTANTFHHIAERTAYFVRARRYLRPGGRVAIIEYAGKGFFNRLFGHWTATDVIRNELEAAGYTLEHEYDFLPRQSFLVFSRPNG